MSKYQTQKSTENFFKQHLYLNYFTKYTKIQVLIKTYHSILLEFSNCSNLKNLLQKNLRQLFSYFLKCFIKIYVIKYSINELKIVQPYYKKFRHDFVIYKDNTSTKKEYS